MTNQREAMMAEFIENEWDSSMVLDPTFLSDKFSLSNRESRYYAQKFVDRGILCKIKIENSIYYVKSEWYDILRKYNDLDNVRIT